ncbi:MAG: ABC transporter ATP-binding protein [Acidobacteria bacterium]|nr:MAG: ABC transporter ATP-binding protein [Acidobacteriota bacterium]
MTQPGAPVSESSGSPTGAPSVPLIELNGLTVRFGNRDILHGLTASLRGRAIGLLGPNGAGKSTLINTLLGFYKPTGGSAKVFGQDIGTNLRNIRSLVGYMPENDAFISKMNAVSFVQMMGELSGLPSRVALERAHEALFYVGLAEARYRQLGTYSLGMKQLAKLAQAIVHGPKLLILDEPTNGLDPSARQRMVRMVREIRDSREMRIVLCSHLLRDVEDTCDEVLILKQGQIAHYSDLDEERRSNKRFVELEIYGANGDFTAAIEKLGCECAVTANRMKMVLADGVETRDIFRIAAEQQVRIRRLNFRRDTLEDIFLKAMES